MWPDGENTQELLRRARAGSDEAVNRLLEDHRAALRRMVAARLDPGMARRADASDVVQDAILAASRKAQLVAQLVRTHPVLAAQSRQTWRIKETPKGPLVWRVKHVLVHIKDERGLPAGPYHLLVCYHPFTDEVKYFLSNAPADTPVKKLLRVAFGRWRIER